MDMRPVGFLDSGRGGLTAVRAFQRILPEENIVFYADTARCPYGTRETAQIRQFTEEILDILLQENVKAIVASCGTVSVNTKDILEKCSVKVVNVLDPAVKAMCSIPGDKALAVMATESSIASGVFQDAIEKVSGRKVYGIACQELVTLCESGRTDRNDKELQECIKKKLGPVREKVDAVLLGCTHFGLAEEAIRDFMPDTRIISASNEAASEMADYLVLNGMTGGEGKEKIICSGYSIC